MVMFLPVAIVFGAFLFWLHHDTTLRERRELSLREQAAVEKAVVAINRDLNGVVGDLRILAALDDLKRLAVSGSAEDRQAVIRQFTIFSAAKQVFDQVRFLDTTGQEVVRIDLHNGRPYVVPDRELQNKRDRYYFRDTIGLDSGQAYVSRFDLNQEHGRIDEPYKPTLRFAMPLADDRGNKQGVVVLNYLGGELLSNLDHSMQGATGRPMMIDQDGYWLAAPDPHLTWGFMYPDGPRFASTYPNSWKQLTAADAGMIESAEGLYFFATILPLLEIEKRLAKIANSGSDGAVNGINPVPFWKVISFVDAEMAKTSARSRARGMAAIYGITMLLWFCISLLLARARAVAAGARALAERLSSVVEQSSDLVFITDPAGRIEYINPSFASTTGWQWSDAIGRSPSILHSGAHPQSFYKDLWNTVLAGRPFEGVFTNRRRDGSLFYEQKTITPVHDRYGRITHLASTGKDITLQMETQERLLHLAYHNPLTGLPNRTLFRDRLASATARAHRNGRLIALLFLDLDHFKNVNDSLGHLAGDQLLQLVATRLTDCVRTSDTVAHVGGDEYAIILDDIHAVDEISPLADKIISIFAQDFHIDDQQVYVGVSIGIALYPMDSREIDELMKEADTALYQAKEAGRNRYAFYHADMTARIHHRLTMETELRHALEGGEFIIHYQPVVDVSSGIITGSEALLRWNHPRHGLLPPSEFIDVLEDSRLIIPATQWLLCEACAANAEMRAATGQSLSIAVNFSARSFVTPSGTLEPLTELLEQSCLNPRQLVVEITESVLLESDGMVEPMLARMRELGVKIAIDDFGTGYSSLNYLKRFTIDLLKIDREFIRPLPGNRSDAALVEGIISMAHGLGVEVVAEGVETAEQLEFLRNLGCDAVQGLLYSPAVPMAELIAFVKSSLPREGQA